MGVSIRTGADRIDAGKGNGSDKVQDPTCVSRASQSYAGMTALPSQSTEMRPCQIAPKPADTQVRCANSRRSAPSIRPERFGKGGTSLIQIDLQHRIIVSRIERILRRDHLASK